MKKENGKMKIFDSEIGKVVIVNRVSRPDEEWKKILTPEQYEITTRKATERSFSCPFLIESKELGIYKCVRCGTDLFTTNAKFDSGTGWPSYFEPVSDLNIAYKEDFLLGSMRTEVLCARCGSHLGHVFDDGPPPSGKRYCINGIALMFVRSGKSKFDEAAFGGGCFWHVEEEFRKLAGVIDTAAGYAGGQVPEPSYEEVCRGDTGHAEVVHVKFDPGTIPYEKLLDVFWSIHDPTQLNRQGPDVGDQYRSVIFYYSPSQKEAAQRSKEKLERSRRYNSPVVTQILPAKDFFRAEEYHQRYLEKKDGHKSAH
ncbi:MAG: bifunctional methionine sulfoxide reductase B/A protein [Candidatus Margulisiibacteriota bacterium]